MRKIKVDVSVIGRFFAFDLARALQGQGMLNALFTTYPKFKAREFGLSDDRVVSCWWCEVVVRLIRKIRAMRDGKLCSSLYHNCYMRALNRYVDKSDAGVFIGFAGVSLDALIRAKSRGMVTILERGSSHRAEQRRIIEEECSLHGLKVNSETYENGDSYIRELKEYELADYISVPSRYVEKTFLDRGVDGSRLIVNPYGVDLGVFRKVEKSDDVFRVLFVGNGSFRKGLHYLLQAFYELDLHNSELCIISAGFEDGMDRYLEKYTRMNLRLCGQKPFDDLYKYYSEASVFVLPSIEEGLALVQLQAMACGLPIICSTNTGGGDIISKDGEEGFVVPIRDVGAIKDRLLFLYENPDILAEMGERARERVATSFTWDSYGARYIKNIERIFNMSAKEVA